tara:strand:+ start:6742 stop:7671 length:930 start_codon:yes stop_codon:yes gene_type:complete
MEKKFNSTLCLTLDDISNKSIYIIWSNEERIKIFNSVLKSYPLTRLAKKLEHDQGVTSDIKNGKVKPSGKIYLHLLRILWWRRELLNLAISSRNHQQISLRSSYVSPELIGLIHSDGLLRLYPNGSVHFCFTNQEKALINRFVDLIHETFKCQVNIRIDKRDGTMSAYPPSIVGRLIASRVGWKFKGYENPDLLPEEIPHYIRGLFDGDGTIYLYTGKSTIPTIRITFQYLKNAEYVQSLLNTLNIYSRICRESRNNSVWYNIVITRQRGALDFITKIGSNHPKKKIRMEKIKKYLLESKYLHPKNSDT